MNNNDPTNKTPLSAPGAGGVAISASPSVSASAAVPAGTVDAGAIPVPVQPAAAVPAPALSILEPDDGPFRQEPQEDDFSEKYERLLDSYPVNDTEELERFLRQKPGLLDALHKIAPQLLDRPDVEDILIRYPSNPDKEFETAVIDVHTHYTDYAAAHEAIYWMLIRIVNPALGPFRSGIFLAIGWKEDQAGEPCPAVPESLDPSIKEEDFFPKRLLPDPPDDEFRHNCRALLDGFPVERSDGLMGYLDRNRDLPGVLLNVLPQIQARPDVDRIWVYHMADPESDYENIHIDVHTSYTEYRPCSRAVWRMHAEIVRPILGFGDMRLCLTSHWRYVDNG